MRRTALTPVLVLGIAVLSGGWFLQRGVGQEENVYTQVRLLQEVVDHLHDRYVDEIPRDSLYHSAIEGLLGEIGDPNTAFLQAAEWENLRIRTQGEYGGVGLEITERGGWVTVVTPLPGGPGMRAGLRAGDQIIEIEGTSTEDWSVDQAVEVLRGEPGTTVSIRVRRPGVDALIPFTLERAVVRLRSVPFTEIIAPRIGYLPLQIVQESSTEEVRAAVDSLRDRGMRGLIIDLRGNPGGLLDQGVAVTDLFLERRSPVVETRGRARGQNETYRASRDQEYPDLAVVVLINEFSASASEIIAGALQDHDRALVIGTTSFGKGSVQTLYRLSGGNVLKLTTARWYTPSGRSIEKERDDQVAVLEGGVPTLAGQLAGRPDTAERPTVESFGGRTLYGGGGITPDRIVLPDTLTTDEQLAFRRLSEAGGAFASALFDYAVRYVQRDEDIEPGFRLPDEALREFRATLPEHDVEVEPEVLDRAERFVRYQLERQIALQAWGERGEFLQVMDDDPPLRQAIEVLREAREPGELFRAAGPVPAGR